MESVKGTEQTWFNVTLFKLGFFGCSLENGLKVGRF